MTQRVRRILFRVCGTAIIIGVIGLLVAGAVVMAAMVIRALDDGTAASPSAWNGR
ncbi:MAG: hypothetical protein KF855_03545 [Acidobacteria bacterium]|nr:hypothetical protein [Acidobacteriota bacterium]